MNFFDDDFGLGTSPSYSKKPSYTSFQKGSMNIDQVSRKSGKKDEFDDLLDDLLGKQDKKNNKKKQKDIVQPYSSAYLEPGPPPMDFKKTEKWSTQHIDLEPNFQSPKFPLGKHTSIMDDRSEDGRSYKSGFTGRQNNFEFDNLMTLRGEPKEQAPALERSSRNMMKPPLRKKDSKQNLIKQGISWDDQPQSGFSRRVPQTTNLDIVPNRDSRGKSKENIAIPSIQVKPKEEEKIKEKIIEREKIVTVREDATELKKQLQNQVKQIKQSYERQINMLQQRLKTQAQDYKKTKETLMKQSEERVLGEKNKWQKMIDQNTQRLKDLHNWQLKKKCEAYQSQIQKLKSLARLEQNALKKQNSYSQDLENLEIKSRQRELQIQRHRLEQLKIHLQQRQKNIEFMEVQFNNYKQKQQEKLQYERRSLYEKQSELKKLQLESKHSLALEKQQIASEIAENELEIYRKKQALNLEREELRCLRQIIEKQKASFTAFNTNILNDYKLKIKQVEAQKQELQQKQVQIHQKIHLLQFAKGKLAGPLNTGSKFNERPSSANTENHRDRSNTELNGRLQETKGRFKEMESMARKINIQMHEERQKIRGKVNLSGYITRVNRALSKH